MLVFNILCDKHNVICFRNQFSQDLFCHILSRSYFTSNMWNTKKEHAWWCLMPNTEYILFNMFVYVEWDSNVSTHVTHGVAVILCNNQFFAQNLYEHTHCSGLPRTCRIKRCDTKNRNTHTHSRITHARTYKSTLARAHKKQLVAKVMHVSKSNPMSAIVWLQFCVSLSRWHRHDIKETPSIAAIQHTSNTYTTRVWHTRDRGAEHAVCVIRANA